MVYTVAPWKHSRFWAIYCGEDLVTVCVYRVGAVALADLLQAHAVEAGAV